MLPVRADRVQAMCAELDAWPERLDARGPLPRAWEGRLAKDLQAEAIQASKSSWEVDPAATSAKPAGA
jgi:hypothetical protein